jgi:hypothetical protein
MTEARFHNCYQDEDPGLSPKSTRLVFKAEIYHGMGHQENQWIRVGADYTKKWDVLWLRTDWDEGTVPLAWVAKGTLRGRALWSGLVHAWFLGSKLGQDADAPPYDEYTSADHALLDEAPVQAIVEQVWPAEEEDETEGAE